MSDINVGQLAEAINDKMDRDAHNIQTPSDIVIAYQNPTAQNDYTWYRKYKSGWVEQGGFYASQFANTLAFTYPIEMADTNYTLTIGAGCPNVSGMHGKDYISSRSTTGFEYTNKSLDGSFQNNNFSWQVSGISA